MLNKKVTNIGSEIWTMANNLRGTMNASDYQEYILAFMFYRYLSIHQEEHLATVIDVVKDEDMNDTYAREVSELGIEDFIEELTESLGYIILPNFTWTSIMKRIENSTLMAEDFSNMFESFSSHGKQIPNSNESYANIFSDINLANSGLGNSVVAKTKALSGIVKLIDSIEYKSQDGKDVLAEIYEYLISQFAANAGKKGGEFYTPHRVSEVLARLVTTNVDLNTKLFSVYDPTMGSGSLLLTVGNQIPTLRDAGNIRYYGQEMNRTTYNLARMNLMMHDVSYGNMNLNNADTLESDWPDGVDANGMDQPRSFDAIVANPPYSAKWDNNENKLKDPRFQEYGKLAPEKKADFAFVQHSIYHLNKTGKMAVVLPHGVLFRGAAEATIRKVLIEKNYLDAVIGLPANLFYGASIPTCILVFSKNKNNKDILFIDASNEFEKGKNQNNITEEHINKIINTYQTRENVEKYAHVATIEEVRENDFNLNIPRYVDTFEEEEEIDLNEVNAEIKKIDAEIAALEEIINEQLRTLGVEI